MKYCSKLISAAIAALLALTMCSCQLSKLMPERTDNPENTTGQLPGFTLPGQENTDAPLDLSTADLTQYVTLGNYKGLSADETVTPLTDEAFEAELNKYISSIPLYEEITDRPTQKGDIIVMDYVGKLDGVPFSGGTAQGQSIELSENSGYIDGFADGLIGVTPGSTVDLNLTFPTDYHAADMAGKTVVFTVTVHYIRGELITATLTDEFVTKFTGGDYTTAEAFRAFYREYMEQEAIEAAHENALSTLWAAVFENSTFHQVPTQQVDDYYAQSKAQYQAYANAYGMTYEAILSTMGLTDEALRTQAEQYAKQDLVFFALVQAEKLTVSEAEYAAGLEKYAAGAGVSTAELEAYYGADYLKESMLWDKMMEMLYSYANITK